jgi:hypothetical protein
VHPTRRKLPDWLLIGMQKREMLSITTVALGRWTVRELVAAAVGMAVGIVVGRVSERSRRSYKDFVAARVALDKGRKIMYTETRKATMTIVVVGAFMLAIFVGALNWPH